MLTYRKIPKNSDTWKIYCHHPKISKRWHYHRVMCPKDAEWIANSVDPDQTAPLGAVCLIWVYTVCPGLSIWKLRIITVALPNRMAQITWLANRWTYSKTIIPLHHNSCNAVFTICNLNDKIKSTVHTSGMLISRCTGTCLIPAALSSGNPVTLSYKKYIGVMLIYNIWATSWENQSSGFATR